MRRSWCTRVVMVVALGLVAACTRTEETPVAQATPAPEAAAQDPAAALEAALPDLGDADEILMVWAEAEPDEGAPPLTVKLTADISGGVGERTVKWDFGDGSPSSGEVNPVHTYEKPGTYRAHVEVKTSDDEDSDYVDIEVETE